MSTKNSIRELFSVKGCDNRINNVIYSPPLDNGVKSIVIYFGGDIQDFNENMMKNEQNKKYVKWSLNNIALLLRSIFINSHIIVVQPSRIELDTFSCFDNFVKSSNNWGNPRHLPTYGGLENLLALIQNVLFNKTVEGENKSWNISEDLNIKLIGFSKGCVVLNQFLYEFHYHLMKKEGNYEIMNFMKRITDMYWLDGGHNGGKNVWITTEELLQTLITLGVTVHAHVTPYQVCDKQRPHIGKEEAIFSKFIADNGGQISRVLHFGNEEPSINNHFKLITEIFTDASDFT